LWKIAAGQNDSLSGELGRINNLPVLSKKNAGKYMAGLQRISGVPKAPEHSFALAFAPTQTQVADFNQRRDQEAF
jgi:hypothetical protein